jgi:signal transduction histidine kinase/ligand-binding sensor domain-containing protein/DNA-binding response OmpR family regulator
MKPTILFFALLALPPLAAAHPYAVKRLGLEQGLSSGYVVGIAQDRQGFVWFATESGLSRFDGKTFKVYKKQLAQHGAGLCGNELNRVVADNTDNVVWVASQRAGLNMFDCAADSFLLFAHNDANENSIISNDVTDIANDSKGNLWVSTYSAGVDYYDKKANTFAHYNRSTLPQLASNHAWCIADNGKGLLYIGHVFGGLSVLSVREKTVKHYAHEAGNPRSLPPGDVYRIFIDKLENVWVGAAGGLALFDPETEEFTSFTHRADKPASLVANTVFEITQTKDGLLWIGAENGGISILDLRKGLAAPTADAATFYNILPSDDEAGLSCATVRAIREDAYGNVWIGTYGGGVNFIAKTPEYFHRWQHFALPAGSRLTVKTAWGMCEDSEGKIWVGTDGGGVQVFKAGKLAEVYAKESGYLCSNAILAALKDSEDNIWLGTFGGGVTRCKAAGKTAKRQLSDFYPGILGGKTIRCLYEDGHKRLWIGTDGHGIYLFDPKKGGLQRYTAEQHSLPADNLIRAIAHDANGRLWVGSFGQGLRVLDSAFRLLGDFGSARQGFYSSLVNCIYRDRSNQMWVGTGEGLAVFPNADSLSAFTVYTEKDGLGDSHIRAITQDRAGNIWCSTNSGVCKYAAEKRKFYTYGSSDGVLPGQFMSGSVVNAKNGWLYFGSQSGVCSFDPEKIPEETDLPPATITGFVCYSGLAAPESMPVLSGNMALKHRQNSFTVTFNVMDYALSPRVEYAYRMDGDGDGDGDDSEWYPAGKSNTVTFQSLPSGAYRFAVKARLNNHEWATQPALLRIRIYPPPALSWWAKMLYAIAAIAVGWCAVRFYKNRIKLENMLYLEKENSRQQQALNNDKLQFFTNITHELRTPLTLIIGPLEDLSGDASLPEKIAKKVAMIYQNALRLLHLINKILEFRKTETNNMPLQVARGDLAQLVREVGMTYRELNPNKEVQFTIAIETADTVLEFDGEVVHIILDNLIANAFKYTKQGEIRVCLRSVVESGVAYAEIEVRDTGCGIPPQEIASIFKRYYQVTGEHQASGTGIGLALVKNLAALHQGTITVESREGAGASFKFRLMANNAYPGVIHAKPKESASYAHRTQDITPEMEPHNGKKMMLVVEDNPDIRTYIWDAFAEDYLVLTADNGKTGVEYALKNIPDIIISDIMMPELSGLELCAALKKDARTCHIPIMLLTAKTSLTDKTDGYAAGADSYITKPFSTTLLRSRASNLLESRKNLASQIVHSKVYKQTLLSDSINKLDNEFLEKVTKIVEENSHSEKLDVELIAQQVHMSHPTLYRKIKALTGCSVNEFIRKIRMKCAEDMLLSRKYTISEVAIRVGISNITYFRQCFKEEFGLTPSEYIKGLSCKDARRRATAAHARGAVLPNL